MKAPSARGGLFRHRLFTTSSIICLAATSPAAAQQIAQFDEIVVTAQKREELLRDVPVSVSAFSETADRPPLSGPF